MTDILTLIGVTDPSSLGLLLPACKVVQQMADTYEHIKFGQKRCKVVVQQAALIIKEVHGNLRDDQTSVAGVTKIQTKFKEIQIILEKLADMSFFKALLHFERINSEIERANGHLADCLQLFRFPIDLSLNVQAQKKAAILSDRDTLQVLLKILAGNYQEVRRRFGLLSDEQEDLAMAVMERELRNTRATPGEDIPVELQIMQKSLECIKTTTGRSAPKQNKWLIAEYDLDYCGTIGAGGFSTVSKAQFRGTMVAVKTLKDVGNMRVALEREIEIWSRLRHDHIVPFYGACTLTSPPYIVSRYMRNGNLVQYLATTPDANRTKLIFEVSLGMYYLHEENIVHGDLKSVNVLVDDSGKACITDFGLSKIYASGKGETKTGRVSGTLPFLAPEALRGQPVSFETDVYAFGIVIYEVFTEEVPFIVEPDHRVQEDCVELRRPTSNKVYERGFNDSLWELLSDCTSHEPSGRPRFKTIQTRLSSIKEVQSSVRLVDPDSTLGTVDKNLTDWGLDSKQITSLPPLSRIDSASPLPERAVSVLADQPRTQRIPRSIKTLPPILPMCIVVTHKYFNVAFSVSSMGPDICLKETNKIRRRVIGAKKGTLLRKEENKFWYRNSAGGGESSWELAGNEVTLRDASVIGVCRFEDPEMAQKWFRLQLSYAHDGSVGSWEMATGGWFQTEQSWRRLVHGKIQHANLVEGDPRTVPTERSWSDADLPKHYTIDNGAGTENRIVCTTNSGKQPGRLCCKLQGRTIILETYRLPEQSDDGLVTAREETYPSKEYAEMTFDVLKAIWGEAARKNSRRSLFAF